MRYLLQFGPVLGVSVILGAMGITVVTHWQAWAVIFLTSIGSAGWTK